MANAYCRLENVKSALSGDVPNMGSSFDQSLVNSILEVSTDFDRQVALCRGDSKSLFSVLADQAYGQQVVYLSSTPAPTSGVFYLSFDGEITLPINFDADAASVQGYLEDLSTVGAGNLTVRGFPGGPWTVDFAEDLSGLQPVIEGRAAVDQTDAFVVVLPMIEGVVSVPSERFFHATPDLWGQVLRIDDCVEVVDVKAYGSSNTVSATYLDGVDYRQYPLRGVPIEGLKNTDADGAAGGWPVWPTVIGVTARWGHALAVPADVREAVVIEVMRNHFSAKSGNDDRVGMTPYGTVVTSKAYTAKFWQTVQDYAHKLWY